MKQSHLQTFGTWLKLRRRALDLTQKGLARQIGCAEITIRKIEADQLRPSKYLARVLLEKLGVQKKEQDDLILLARRNSRFKP